MAVPSVSLRSKLALDHLIKSYLETEGGGVGEQMQVDEFEAAYFRDVVGSSLASAADLVTVAALEQLLAWARASLDLLRPPLLALCRHVFMKR
jgi:hypothetical protein